MCWIKQTANDARVIGADNLHEMLIMIDSAHAVHNNMRGHTGGITSFGTGIVDQKASKQKMNTHSSTETEHIGTSKYLPKPIFLGLFMAAQGYKPKVTLVKDNKSKIKLFKNRHDSCTSNSKHVSIKQFWSTDQIKAGRLKVKYCPTDKMLADFMSKPVQGSLFQKFRNAIMGWEHIHTLYDVNDTTKEHVEKSEQNLNKPKMSYADVIKC